MSVTPASEKAQPASEPGGEKASRVRQRQRLIEACISALYAYGPSRTTVEKVVSIADLSPGIVNFYFESKAAMMVAALEFLAGEFEREVLEPVAHFKDDPVHALELLVDLYLDPEIASPRKVSVWFAFWGEANSRKEYYDICGKRDEAFAALVQDLIERLIVIADEPHLEADGVALGLIGALDTLWQNFAFEIEANIDRPDAKRRCMGFLRSVFPRQFGSMARLATLPAVPHGSDSARIYTDPTVFVRERDRLFLANWQLVGAESAISAPGGYLTLSVLGDRILVLRDAKGAIRAFRNRCRHRPHALAEAASGRFVGKIRCDVDGQVYGFDGRAHGRDGLGALDRLGVRLADGIVFVHLAGPRGETVPTPRFAQFGLDALRPTGTPGEIPIAADWKLIVEQYLDRGFAVRAEGRMAGLATVPDIVFRPIDGGLLWQAPLAPTSRKGGWTARLYVSLASRYAKETGIDPAWIRLLEFPGRLFEIRPDGGTIVDILPDGPGRSTVRRFEFARPGDSRLATAFGRFGRRLGRNWLAADLAAARSTQLGLMAPSQAPGDQAAQEPAVDAFRFLLAQAMPEHEPR